MSGPDQQNPGDEPVNVGNQEPFQATGAIELLPPNPGLALRPKKKSTGLLIFGLFGVLVLAMGALVMPPAFLAPMLLAARRSADQFGASGTHTAARFTSCLSQL